MSERRGTVVAVHGIRATVLMHDDQSRVRCRPMRDRRRLAVGDQVEVDDRRHGSEIVAVDERSRCLWRPQERGRSLMAAHVDRVLVVVSARPEPKPGLVDRFLIATDAADIEAVIVVNKADLPELAEARRALDAYQLLGYPFLEVSAHSGAGLSELEARVATGMSVFCGHSGVGKSSLLNRLVPDADLRTGQLNEVTGKGRHTTSVTTCHLVGDRWPGGAAMLVDTPGVRGFGLYGLPLVDIAHGFRDLRPWRVRCHFRDCLHEEEPGCAVRDAVEAGEVSAVRYEGYRRILGSVRAGTG